MGRTNEIRNWLFLGILVFSVSMSFSVSSVEMKNCNILFDKGPDFPSVFFDSNGSILYVGGTEPDNYTRIQDAIDNASDGDTVFVFDDMSPYYENIVVDKSINLIGEDKETTVIDGQRIDDVIYVTADWVNISGFTIQKSKIHSMTVYAGIEIMSDNNIIEGNILIDNNEGIFIANPYSIAVNSTVVGNIISNNSGNGIGLCVSSDIFISDNVITDNGWDGIGILYKGGNIVSNNTITGSYANGIFLSDSSQNEITNNVISDDLEGISLFWKSSHNVISKNIISNSTKYEGITIEMLSNHNIVSENVFTNLYRRGVRISNSSYNIITQNTISNCSEYDIYIIKNSSYNSITMNTFEKKNVNAFFSNSFKNEWDANYWGNPKILPKLIFGKFGFGFTEYPLIPWLNVDWHPAREPYDISI